MSTLAYVEHCLPAPDTAGRLALAREHGLALEVANRPGTDFAALRASGLECAAVHAWGLHDAHPLHPDGARRAEGLAHAIATVDLAADLGAPRALVVLGFGDAVSPDPQGCCRDFLAAVATRARERGIRVMVEPISRRRAPAEAGPSAVARLLDEAGEPDVLGTLLDTGHLLDDGLDPAEVIASWPHAVDAVQLRGPVGAPPGPDDPVEAWVRAAVAPAVVSVEHRVAIAPDDLPPLLGRIRAALA